MLTPPKISIPIINLYKINGVEVFLKREDLIHNEISGNKFWKLFHNVNQYLSKKPIHPLIITFGGAYSNHIAAVAAFGKLYQIPTIGIIRGEELKDNYFQNPTLINAEKNGMKLRFVNRKWYSEKQSITEQLVNEFPNSLIIPEGGTNELGVLGIQNMLTTDTKEFDYICTAVGTGGTIAGLSKFAEKKQKILGFLCVKDASLEKKIYEFSKKYNFKLLETDGLRYGKISDENVEFINQFQLKHKIPLDPIYTSKMMMKLNKIIEQNFFPEGSRVLCIHTGGLQGIKGANLVLKNKNRKQIIL